MKEEYSCVKLWITPKVGDIVYVGGVRHVIAEVQTDPRGDTGCVVRKLHWWEHHS